MGGGKMMLREPLIPSVTQSKVRSIIHKVMSFLGIFAKKSIFKGGRRRRVSQEATEVSLR